MVCTFSLHAHTSTPFDLKTSERIISGMLISRKSIGMRSDKNKAIDLRLYSKAALQQQCSQITASILVESAVHGAKPCASGIVVQKIVTHSKLLAMNSYIL